MTEQLKPCPFCGSEPHDAHHIEYGRWAVTCKCGVMGACANTGPNASDAAKIKAYNDARHAWSTRALTTSQPAQAGELLKCAMRHTPVWKSGVGGLPYQESNFACETCGYVGKHDMHPGCKKAAQPAAQATPDVPETDFGNMATQPAHATPEPGFDDCPSSPTGKHSESWFGNGDCDHCKTGAQNAPMISTHTQQAAGEPVGEPGRAFYEAHCFAFDIRTDWGSLPAAVQQRYALASAKLYTHQAPGVPEGFALVPVEPTEEMINAGVDAALLVADDWCSGDERKNPHIERWKAMLAAAQAKGADPEDLAAAGVMLMGRRADHA